MDRVTLQKETKGFEINGFHCSPHIILFIVIVVLIKQGQPLSISLAILMAIITNFNLAIF